MKLPSLAGALSFAHLSGLVAGKTSNAAGEEKEEKDEKNSRAAADDESDKDDKDDKGAKSAASEEKDDKDDKSTSSEEKDDKDGEGDKKGKSAKGSKSSKSKETDGDDDDDEEMRGNSAAASARRRERARCAAIFGSRAAAGNPVLAANLAFNTSMSRQEALAVLENTPAAVQQGGNRAANNPNLGIGEAPARSSAAQLAESWDCAMAAVAKRS